MFPPASAARSTVTLPGGIASIMAFLIIKGAFLPEGASEKKNGGRKSARKNRCEHATKTKFNPPFLVSAHWEMVSATYTLGEKRERAFSRPSHSLSAYH